MKKFLCLSIFFIAILAVVISLIHLMGEKRKINIPSSFKTLNFYPAPKIIVTGPLVLPQSLASNVLGLAHVAPKDIIFFVNRARGQTGSGKLETNLLLTKAAQMRVETILKHENFSHDDPYENIQLNAVIPKVGYTFSYISENIGLGEQDAESFVNGFLSSPPHKQNLLDRQLIETGVGVKAGKFKDREVTIVVQIFGVPAPQAFSRGYPDNEETNLRNMIVGLNDNLVRTEGYLTYEPNSSYYLGWKELLTRQIGIVREVLAVVEKGQPYTDKERSLIAEYNQNWNSAPR